MAKKSMIARELKRLKTVRQYAAKRTELKTIIANPNSEPEARIAAQEKLHKQPRNACAARVQRRCRQTGRPHGVYRKFGLCRNKLREATMRGDVPGLVKASW
jgi:small subunit ribosomal protein S14